jgi:hypothetical protein
MARIPESDIERLKREVSVERLAESRGVKLKRRGEDAHSGLAIDTANVSLSGDGKDNFLHASIVTA